jgi:hypothetical protein
MSPQRISPVSPLDHLANRETEWFDLVEYRSNCKTCKISAGSALRDLACSREADIFASQQETQARNQKAAE